MRCFPRQKESSKQYSLATPRSKAPAELDPWNEYAHLFPSSQWQVIPGLPVPMIDFGCDLLLELCQFVLGECSRQDLGPPLNQAVRHLLQPAEEYDLVVLGWENEMEKGTKNCNGGWECLLTLWLDSLCDVIYPINCATEWAVHFEGMALPWAIPPPSPITTLETG